MRRLVLALALVCSLPAARTAAADPPNSWPIQPPTGSFNLSTVDGCGKFTEASALALHAVDGEFGHLRKPPGRSHVVDSAGNLHAVDVVLYRSTGQIVDIVSSCGDPGAHVAWSVGPRGEYGAGDWYVPVGGDAPAAPAPTTPISVGGNDLAALLSMISQLYAKIDADDDANERRYRDLAAHLNLTGDRLEVAIGDIQQLAARPLPSSPVVIPQIPGVPAADGTSAWDVMKNVLIILAPIISALGVATK